jgi:hypothetical protein
MDYMEKIQQNNFTIHRNPINFIKKDCSDTSESADSRSQDASFQDKMPQRAMNSFPLLDLASKSPSDNLEEEKGSDSHSKGGLMHQQGEISYKQNMMLLNSVKFTEPPVQNSGTNSQKKSTGTGMGISNKKELTPTHEGNGRVIS